MTKKLNFRHFNSEFSLMYFVNDNEITQENIQNIIECNNEFILFYWEYKE